MSTSSPFLALHLISFLFNVLRQELTWACTPDQGTCSDAHDCCSGLCSLGKCVEVPPNDDVCCAERHLGYQQCSSRSECNESSSSCEESCEGKMLKVPFQPNGCCSWGGSSCDLGDDSNPGCNYLQSDCEKKCGGTWTFIQTSPTPPPSPSPTQSPSTGKPTTSSPTVSPTTTSSPTLEPTTAKPTTAQPTISPTSPEPTSAPTPSPTSKPTANPTSKPTMDAVNCCANRNSGYQECDPNVWCQQSVENCSTCHGIFLMVPHQRTGCCTWNANMDCSNWDPGNNPGCQYMQSDCEGDCYGIWKPFST